MQAERWLNHVKKVYPDDWLHIVMWLAWRVQHPEIKINHNLVLSGHPGVGKDTLLQPAIQAVGPWNCTEISPEELLGNFNGCLKAVLLRVSEARDMGEVNKFQLYERMKTMGAVEVIEKTRKGNLLGGCHPAAGGRNRRGNLGESLKPLISLISLIGTRRRPRGTRSASVGFPSGRRECLPAA
jgi:hypothetical protein